MNDGLNLNLPSLNESEKQKALSVSKKMSIVDQILLLLLCDDMKKKEYDIDEILSLLEDIGLDQGELHVLHKKCCQENFDQVRIVLYGWARGQITTNELKKKISKKSEFHTLWRGA